MNLWRMTHSHLLFSPPSYLWHIYLFILVQGSEVQITGVIALVMVLQLADLEMMDTEVCILRLWWSHRSRDKENRFLSCLSSKGSIKVFHCWTLAPHFKCIINWQVVIRLSPVKILFLLFFFWWWTQQQLMSLRSNTWLESCIDPTI